MEVEEEGEVEVLQRLGEVEPWRQALMEEVLCLEQEEVELPYLVWREEVEEEQKWEL